MRLPDALEETGDLRGEGPFAERSAVVDVDAQAGRDEVCGLRGDGALDDRVEVALPGHAEADQVPAEAGGRDRRPGLARAGGGAALADRGAVGDPAGALRQRVGDRGTDQLEGAHPGAAHLRQPDAYFVLAAGEVVGEGVGTL